MKKLNNKNYIFWCLRQNKGINLEDKNENLSKVYIQKAKSALDIKNIISNSKKSRNFVLEMEKTIENISESQIQILREKLRKKNIFF